MSDATQQLEAQMLTSSSRLNRDELMSGLGALVLGIGLGALGAGHIKSMGMAMTVIGAVLHALGMWDKHRLEGTGAAPWWVPLAYWLCWILLGLLALYVGAGWI